MGDRILRLTETTKRVGFCGAHIARLEKAGLFPKRFKMNPDSGKYGAVGHLESHIDKWMKERAASVDTQAEPEPESDSSSESDTDSDTDSEPEPEPP